MGEFMKKIILMMLSIMIVIIFSACNDTPDTKPPTETTDLIETKAETEKAPTTEEVTNPETTVTEETEPETFMEFPEGTYDISYVPQTARDGFKGDHVPVEGVTVNMTIPRHIQNTEDTLIASNPYCDSYMVYRKDIQGFARGFEFTEAIKVDPGFVMDESVYHEILFWEKNNPDSFGYSANVIKGKIDSKYEYVMYESVSAPDSFGINIFIRITDEYILFITYTDDYDQYEKLFDILNSMEVIVEN